MDKHVCGPKHGTSATEAAENAQTGLDLDTEKKRGRHLELLACH